MQEKYGLDTFCDTATECMIFVITPVDLCLPNHIVFLMFSPPRFSSACFSFQAPMSRAPNCSDRRQIACALDSPAREAHDPSEKITWFVSKQVMIRKEFVLFFRRRFLAVYYMLSFFIPSFPYLSYHILVFNNCVIFCFRSVFISLSHQTSVAALSPFILSHARLLVQYSKFCQTKVFLLTRETCFVLHLFLIFSCPPNNSQHQIDAYPLDRTGICK